MYRAISVTKRYHDLFSSFPSSNDEYFSRLTLRTETLGDIVPDIVRVITEFEDDTERDIFTDSGIKYSNHEQLPGGQNAFLYKTKYITSRYTIHMESSPTGISGLPGVGHQCQGYMKGGDCPSSGLPGPSTVHHFKL